MSTSGLSNRSRFQQRRATPTYSNNSVRRTYDLLRSTLPSLGLDAQLVEEELISSLSASRNTVRVVLQLLAAQGLVTRGPKVGTTVGGYMVLSLDELMPIPDQGPRRSMKGRVLESSMIAAPLVVSRRLEVDEGQPVALIEALIAEDDTPIAISASYVAVPAERTEALQSADPDPVVYLEDQCDICVTGSDAVVAAITADPQTAGMLEVAEGVPILLLEDLFRDHDGRPRAITQTRYRGDRVAFSATAQRSSRYDDRADDPTPEVVRGPRVA